MTRTLRTTVLLAGAALALSACGGNGKTVMVTPPAATTTTSPASFQSKFGTTFAADFNASANSEPVKPAATDVPALNLTAEPLDN